ncbi:prolyl oligopeptidase family serine peptidase [Elizabethkingia sp. HX QKY]|uniref:alpha/beta hydrolase family protein n=1 Tax=Elizabethkingia TaxID=308865 RepID=UPI002A244F7D|nr:prolyl oligopeptidase family serine peptidase [Elizabethkingia sp. HX QKY]MDX8572206.1 prolyl oligopeptidase family serine peptidase [Elizabethkingia sp. HX QKY]
MKAIKIKALLCIVIFCMCSQGLLGQYNIDSIKQRYAAFYTIAHLKVSDDNRWISFSKIYKKNTDTTIVATADQYQSVKAVFVGVSESYFLKDNHFFWSGNGKAQIINLRNSEKKDFKEVSKIEILSTLGYYAVLYKSRFLEVFDSKDKLIASISDVTQLVNNKRDKLYVIVNQNNLSSVWSLQSKEFKKVYTSEQDIKKIMIAPSQKYLAVTEQEKSSDGLQLVLLGTNSLNVSRVGNGFIKSDYIEVREINNGSAFFLDFNSRPKRAPAAQPEIKYGIDPDLWLYRMGDQHHEYWVHNFTLGRSQKINNNQMFMATIDHDRYFLSFDRKERNAYISSVSWFDIYLYDLFGNTSKKIFTQTSSLVVSRRGEYIIGFNEEKKRWILYHTLSSKEMIIENAEIQRPVFSDDNRFVFFESSSGIYQLDLHTQNLSSISLTENKKVAIVNAKEDVIYGTLGADFRIRSVNTKKPIIIEQYDQNTNETSYIQWFQHKIEVLLPATKNRVSDFKITPRRLAVFSLEENFNIPQAIYQYHSGHKKKVYQSNRHDHAISLARQDILSYKNSLGVPVKGVLYYPLNFDAQKKYPLVLSIYEVQNKSASVYPFPYFSGIGANIRSLIDNGYFVFLPDVVLDSRGAGFSALDCVHSGLDALKGYTNIDSNRAGLMGHSFGGFGTSFIATRSNRFTAYISGAAVTDLVKFYFSFSQERNLPNYPRFENGQFDMKVPFSKNKTLYYDNSPIANVEKVNKPILLWTGLKDGNVPYTHTEELYTGLVRNQKKAIVLYYKDQDHDLAKNSTESIDLHLRILEWWDYFLKDKKDIPWIDKEMKKDAL